MKARLLNIITFLVLAISHATAQVDVDGEMIYQINEYTTVDLGDGRIFYRNADRKEPLNGKVRLLHHRNRSGYQVVNFVNGLMDGVCRTYGQTVLVSETEYVKGINNGIFRNYHSDGKTIAKEANISQGKVNGVVKEFDQLGRLIAEKEYDHAVESGIDRTYDPKTGEIYNDRNYKNGVLHGRQVFHMSDDLGEWVETSNYDMGKQIGEFTQVYSNGNIRMENKFEGNTTEIRTAYYPDGKPMRREIFVNGLKDGEFLKYYTNGNLEKRILYINDNLKSVTAYFFDSDRVKSEHLYDDNRQDGTYKLYYENGALREEGRTKNGNEVYKRIYFANGQLQAVLEKEGFSWQTIEEYTENGTQVQLIRIL